MCLGMTEDMTLLLSLLKFYGDGGRERNSKRGKRKNKKIE
jgi:IS4 transposase